MDAGQNSAWRVGDVLKWTADYFGKKGIDSPRLTSEILLSRVLGISRLDLYLGYDKPLNQEERSQFRELIKRRAQREPLAYILGEKAFWKLDLKVSPFVLIPRSDTELLIEIIADEVKKDFYSCRNLFFSDLGTGSGAIALSILAEIENSFAVASDFSADALSVASTNAVLNGLADRISFVRSSWCDAFSRKFQFDFIVSNPPYIRSDVIPGLEPEVSAHEPISALDGGEDGLSCIKEIVSSVFDHIKHSGFLVIEIGYDQGRAVSQILESSGFCDDIRIIKDYGGNDRLAFARKINFSI